MKKTLLYVFILVFSITMLGTAQAEPDGKWSQFDEIWYYLVQQDYSLSESESAALSQVNSSFENSIPADSVLSVEEYLTLFPNAELPFEISQPEDYVSEAAPVALFELDGSWYYDNGILCYAPSDGSAVLTKDQVFSLLYPDSAATEKKVIYFTFDDSPSAYTMDLLATLRACNVKATFFVNGSRIRRFPVFLQAIFEEGHVIANHSDSHNASILSSSPASCLHDFQRCQETVNEALGCEYPMTIARFPYGASTVSPETRVALQEEGYMWLDWNALDGDTEPTIHSDKDAYNRAVSTARGRNTVVMLFHDGKKRTIRILPELISYFREQGYEFSLLTTDIEPLEGVRMGFPIED